MMFFAHQIPHPAYQHIHLSPPKTEEPSKHPIPASFSYLLEALILLATVSRVVSPQPEQPQPIASHDTRPVSTHVPFKSSSTHHSSSTSQHSATYKTPGHVRDRPPSLLEWYLLLAGLLFGAVLEGRLSAGWRRWQVAQCLLLVGLRFNEGPGEDKDGGENEEDESEFDPDELPGLVDAIKILFLGLRRTGSRGSC